MLIKRSEYEALYARINALEAENQELRQRNYSLYEEVDASYTENYDLMKKNFQLKAKMYEMEITMDEMKEQVEDFLYDMKEKAEFVYDEILSKDAYIAELEEALDDEVVAPEEDIVEAECTVVEEVLLLMAPVMVEEVAEEVVVVAAEPAIVEVVVETVAEPVIKIVVEKPQPRNSRAKAVICITTGLTFDSIKEAADYYGIKTSNSISKCCNGKQKSAGKHNGQKLEWQFAA